MGGIGDTRLAGKITSQESKSNDGLYWIENIDEAKYREIQ